MSGGVFQNLSIFSTKPSLKLSVSSTIQTSPILLASHWLVTPALQSLSHCRLVADLSIFYLYSHGNCSLEIKNIIPDPERRVLATRSPFQVTIPNPQTQAHTSPFIPRTSQLWNSLPSTTSPSPTTYLLSYLRSINLILSPYLLNLSPFS